jgi:threonine dehydratase
LRGVAHAVAASSGAQVFLKFENLQFTASFKERGACNKLSAARRKPTERCVAWSP